MSKAQQPDERYLKNALQQADSTEEVACKYGVGTALGLEAHIAAKTIRAQHAHIADLEVTHQRELAAYRTTVENLERKVEELEAAPAAQAVEPEFFTVFASHNGGKIALPGYSNETEKGVKDLVLQAARQEGYKGTVSGRLLELGWWIGPVFASPYEAAAPAPAAVAVPNGWREKFAAEVYANLAAADNQDIPLEDYPARILKVLDSIVGPRHPVVIQWRNDAIQNCIAISYKYCRDPESHKYLKQDLEALLAATPPAQMGDSPVSNVETTDPQAQDVQREADMFWDSDDGERCEHDIESLIEGYSDGAILKIERAKSLPSITIRVIQSAEGADYEIIDRAAIAASAAQGEA